MDKLDAIESARVETIVCSNPGCMMHIQAGLQERGSKVRTRHIAEVLWLAHHDHAGRASG
jgi:Fe-S oxidoreductase